MLIPRLKKSWITKSETPNSSFNYPKLRLRHRVGLFNLSLDRFGFCNPRLFKSWDYLNALKNMYSVCCASVCSINEVMLPRMLHSAKRNPITITYSFSKYFTYHIIISWVQIFKKVSRIILSTHQRHYFRSIYNYNIVMNCHHCMAHSREWQFRSF